MGLERLVEDQTQDYIGKAALEALKASGVDRKLVGIELQGDELRAEMSRAWDVSLDGSRVGHMTDAVWSPGLRKNIGYVWVPIELAAPGSRLDVETERGEHLVGITAAIPFVDPRKERPAGSLAEVGGAADG
jgi:aminomethyltransferase